MGALFTADQHFRRGLRALGDGDASAALEHFRISQRLEPDNASFRSYLGLCLGLVDRRFDAALELCRSAARDEFYNPLVYHNLGRVHLSFGFKAEGLRYLRRGLMIDPDNAAIQQELAQLGMRRRPVLGFLRRNNPMNRWLGRLLVRLAPLAPRAQPAPTP